MSPKANSGEVEFAELWRAWLACRRRKRGSRDCLRYSGRLLDHLAATCRALNGHTWRPSRTRVFITRRPKLREIHVPAFSDRVVHHWLVPQLEEIYEPIFIHDSFANRLGKGTHAAVDRLQSMMLKASCNGQRRAWALQLDIASCFNSINRRVLFGLIESRLARVARIDPSRRERHALLTWVCRVLLTGNAAEGAWKLGPVWRFDQVPMHKRLRLAQPECGLAIGNLSSQFFSNVYLNELDQFVKHELGCRFYVRYVDDIVLLADSIGQLIDLRDRISAFLGIHLGLSLKDPHASPIPVARGTDFLGYVVKPRYRLVRERVANAACATLDAWHRVCIGPHGLDMERKNRQGLRAALASYLGHFRHAQCWRLEASLLARHQWLNLVFRSFHPRLESRLHAPVETSLAGQWSWFKAQYPGCLVWLQVGAEWQCFDNDAVLIGKLYRLSCDCKPRAGFSESLSIRNVFQWRRDWVRDGLSVITAEQCGRVIGHRNGLSHRVLNWASPRAMAA